MSPVLSHSHPPVPPVVCRRTAVTAKCITVDGNPLASVRGAFDSIVCSSTAEQVIDVPTYDSVRRILNRQCALHVPRLSQTCIDVVTEGKWGETLDGR